MNIEPTQPAAIAATGSSRRSLWGIRLHFLAFIGGSGFLIPFLALFFRRQGLSGTEIGFLYTAGAIATLVAAPLWGSLGDRSAHPRRLIQVSLVLTAIAVIWLGRQSEFLWLALAMSAMSFAGAGIDPASAALALGATKSGGAVGFGSVRLWGSLGWAACTLAGGWLIERLGILAGFNAYALSLLFSTLALSLVGSTGPSVLRAEAAPFRGIWKTARDVLRSRAMAGLAAALSLVWLSTGGLHQFEVIYMDQLGAKETIIGLSSTLTALLELPAMLFADRLVRRFSAGWLLRLAMLIDILRSLIILASPSLGMIVASRAVGALSFSFYTVGVVMYIGQFVPGRQSATVLAIFTVTLRSLIEIAGAPLTGLAFDLFGAYWLYAIALFGVFLAWMVLRIAASGPVYQSTV